MSCYQRNLFFKQLINGEQDYMARYCIEHNEERIKLDTMHEIDEAHIVPEICSQT